MTPNEDNVSDLSFETTTVVRPCVKCQQPLKMDVWLDNVDSPNTTHYHLFCAASEFPT